MGREPTPREIITSSRFDPAPSFGAKLREPKSLIYELEEDLEAVDLNKEKSGKPENEESLKQ